MKIFNRSEEHTSELIPMCSLSESLDCSFVIASSSLSNILFPFMMNFDFFLSLYSCSLGSMSE
jgi:hypothetical protein